MNYFMKGIYMIEIMKARHSVRQYLNKPLETNIINEMKKEIEFCNQESGLHIQLIVNELNQGQQKKLVRNAEVKALLDRYGVQYAE